MADQNQMIIRGLEAEVEHLKEINKALVGALKRVKKDIDTDEGTMVRASTGIFIDDALALAEKEALNV